MTNEEIWRTLYDAQFHNAMSNATWQWNAGHMHLKLFDYPRVEDISIPHWRILPIVGKSPEPEFWYRLSRGIFNVNMRLRSEDNLAYLEERDYFHDVFGHLPILFNQDYSNYIRALGVFAQYMEDTEVARKAISNLYWFTAEFGLTVDRDGSRRAYGAGILSSQDELKYAMSDEPTVIHFGINETDKHNEEIIRQIAYTPSYITDGFQSEYYCVDGFEMFGTIIKWLWTNHAR